MNILAENISRRRKELKITQKQLAEMLNISDKTVSRWETGVQVPDGLIIPDIAAALNTSIGRLYGQVKDAPLIAINVDNNIIATYKATLTAGVIIFLLSAAIAHTTPVFFNTTSALFYCTIAVATAIICRGEIKFRGFYKNSPIYENYHKINNLYLAYCCTAVLAVFNILYQNLTPFGASYYISKINTYIPFYHIIIFIVNTVLIIFYSVRFRYKKAVLSYVAATVLFSVGLSFYIFYPDPAPGVLWTEKIINFRKYSQYLFFAGSIRFSSAHIIDLFHFITTLRRKE